MEEQDPTFGATNAEREAAPPPELAPPRVLLRVFCDDEHPRKYLRLRVLGIQLTHTDSHVVVGDGWRKKLSFFNEPFRVVCSSCRSEARWWEVAPVRIREELRVRSRPDSIRVSEIATRTEPPSRSESPT